MRPNGKTVQILAGLGVLLLLGGIVTIFIAVTQEVEGPGGYGAIAVITGVILIRAAAGRTSGDDGGSWGGDGADGGGDGD